MRVFIFFSKQLRYRCRDLARDPRKSLTMIYFALYFDSFHSYNTNYKDRKYVTKISPTMPDETTGS